MENGHTQHVDGANHVETVTLNKKGNSLGLSIVAAKVNKSIISDVKLSIIKSFYYEQKGESQQFQGIYIKAIVPSGAAEDDGRLQAGDQILCVDKISLIDITQEQ